jgi:cell division protein FtsI (penicillin-binding protein 3)
MFEIGTDIYRRRNFGNGALPRLRFIYGLFVIVFAIFIMRTVQLGVEGTDRARRGNGAGNWAVTRADIVDRNGDILATNVISGHIVLRPRQVSDTDAAARAIHDALPGEYSLSRALSLFDTEKQFIYVKKLAPADAREFIKNAKVKGLDIEQVQTRKYPKRRLFAHAVGFVGGEGKGLEGAELFYDKYLRENTDPLRLSLDSRIQSIFYEELSRATGKYQAKGAMGMLMNSRTGEMLAMVSLPDFDPENVSADSTARRVFAPMRFVVEMGSIFKIFNTALAIESGIGLKKEYYVAKPYSVLDYRGHVAAVIRDHSSFKPPRPNLSVAEIMQYSCNAGSVQIALDLPNGAQKEFFERLHFDRALDLEFGRTERPLMPLKWGPTERATVSFGHGISITPMHLLLAVNSMVNGGFYIWPTMMKRSLGTVEGERVVAPEISPAIRDIMHKISVDGSGKKANIAGINIGGKTATAEKRTNGVIDKHKNLTAFVGAFPIEAPQYVILIVLDEPKGTEDSFGLRTAAWNAVPTTGRILDATLPLLFN